MQPLYFWQAFLQIHVFAMGLRLAVPFLAVWSD